MQSRFKEAALATQEKEAIEAEGETQAMLFMMLQDQHDKQIAAMEAMKKGKHGSNDGADECSHCIRRKQGKHPTPWREPN
jgi:hypothetical protein